jgi:endonuclease/exonuclease/phosphatase family metal-dependent hydrolase
MMMRWSHLFSLAALAAITFPAASAQTVDSLRVMTFNVWSAEGSQAGRDILVDIMQAGGADIIGVQELTSTAAQQIALALDYYYQQQSVGDIQVLSRYPIIGQSARNLGALIELSPGQNVWLFNAHLAAYPYQPYDLRDGTLPQNETAVIAAANSARGAQVTTYLQDMAGPLASGTPVFFTGDFNEPSHLDWTQEAADASSRPFDLKVEYPASKRITDAGMTDSFRAVRSDEVGDTAYTWTPGAPPPNVSSNEVHDRIDLVYHQGADVVATEAWTIGLDASNSNTDIGVASYNADHRAVVVAYDVPDYCFLLGDFNGDCILNADDWSQFRGGQHADLSRLTAEQAYDMGDLNGDFQNNHADFVLFKETFDRTNGIGAFAEMVVSVPEPSAVALGMAAVAALFLFSQRRPWCLANVKE